MKKVYVIGSLNVDYFMEIDSVPVLGETLISKSLEIKSGGKGANQAVAANKMGVDISFLGSVGDDANGDYLRKKLFEQRLKATLVVSNLPTGTAMIMLHNKDNMIIVNAGANNALTDKDVTEFLNDGASNDILLTQLEIPNELVLGGLMLAKQKRMLTILNAAPMNENVIRLLDYVDILIINEIEMEMISKESDILKSCEMITQIHDMIVIVTLGSRGHAIYINKELKKYPSFKSKVVDTTGAGDTFCGVFAASLSEGNSVEKSAILGARAASLAIQIKGAQEAMPNKQDLLGI